MPGPESVVQPHLNKPHLSKVVGTQLKHEAWLDVLNALTGGKKAEFRIPRTNATRFEISLLYNPQKDFGEYKVFDTKPPGALPRYPLYKAWKEQLAREGIKLPPYHSWTFYNPSNLSFNPGYLNLAHDQEHVGVRVGLEDLRLKLILAEDASTHRRSIQSYSSAQQASDFIKKNLGSSLMPSFSSLMKLGTDSNRHNEILAGAFWKCDGSSMIVCYKPNCSRSRLLAQVRALDVERILESNPDYYAKNQYHRWYPGYKVPIIFWNAGAHNCTIYNTREQEYDFNLQSNDEEVNKYRRLIRYMKFNNREHKYVRHIHEQYLGKSQNHNRHSRNNIVPVLSLNQLDVYSHATSLKPTDCDLCKYIIEQVKARFIKSGNTVELAREFMLVIDRYKFEGVIDFASKHDNNFSECIFDILNNIAKRYDLSSNITDLLVDHVSVNNNNQRGIPLLFKIMIKSNSYKTVQQILGLIENLLYRSDISEQNINQLINQIEYCVKRVDASKFNPRHILLLETMMKIMPSGQALSLAAIITNRTSTSSIALDIYRKCLQQIKSFESLVIYNYNNESPVKFIHRVLKICNTEEGHKSAAYYSNYTVSETKSWNLFSRHKDTNNVNNTNTNIAKSYNQVITEINRALNNSNDQDIYKIFYNINKVIKCTFIRPKDTLFSGLFYISRVLGVSIQIYNESSLIFDEPAHGLARPLIDINSNYYGPAYKSQMSILYNQNRSVDDNGNVPSLKVRSQRQPEVYNYYASQAEGIPRPISPPVFKATNGLMNPANTNARLVESQVINQVQPVVYKYNAMQLANLSRPPLPPKFKPRSHSANETESWVESNNFSGSEDKQSPQIIYPRNKVASSVIDSNQDMKKSEFRSAPSCDW